MSNDKYRKIIFDAQAYANAGGTTYEKAVDMATRDFLRAGINCIEYKNGARHTISDYADMCIKTATKRAYLTGEGEKRKEWGIATVIVNKRQAACPKCMKFAGVVLIDDVWSGGKPDGKHQLMSSAIEKGLYHPRCKDVHTTYFPGISTMPDKLSNEEKESLIDDYNEEQKQSYFERQVEQQERLARYSLDSDNKKIYQARAKQWKKQEYSAIEEYTASRKEYNAQIQRLAELEKETDNALDAYMDVMDTPQAAEYEAAFNKKFDETESLKQIVKDLKATLSGKEAKAVRQVEKNLAVKTGIPIDKIEMSGLQYDTANMVFGSYKTVLNKYPELKGQLASFKYDGAKGNAYASCRTLTGEIQTHGMFADYDKLVQKYASDVAAGFHPVGTDHNSIIVHELGHALDGYMTKKKLLGADYNQYGVLHSASQTAKDMTLKFLGFNRQEIAIELKNQGLTLSQRRDILNEREKEFITNHISEYAAENEKEFFAECFAEYMMSDNPRKAAKIFGEIIEAALGR